MNLPKSIDQFMRLMTERGIENYLVGGSIRDMVLGRQPKDYDFAVNMTENALQALAKKRGFYKLGKSDTYGFVLGDLKVELTPIKHRSASGIRTGGDIYTDLECRDFTMNAMAYSIQTGLIDPFGGVRDIENKCIRALYPDKILIEDPLRSLRALRLYAELDFSIDCALERAMAHRPLTAGQASPERVREELFKMLRSKNASDAIRKMVDYGIGAGYLYFEYLFRTRGYDQENPYHNRTLLEHTLTAVENVPNRIELKLAALFHDVGKPDVKTIDSVAHYYGHEAVSAQYAQAALKELKCSIKLMADVSVLIEAHMFNPADMGKKGMKRLLVKVGGFDTLRDLLDLMRADILGTAYPERISVLERLYHMVEDLEREEALITIKSLDINGRDLLELGFAQGRVVGNCLNEMFEQVLREELDNDKSVLLAYAKNYLELHG